MGNTINTGSKNVTAAGTAEALTSTRTIATWVIIQAKSGNTNAVYVGDSTVSSTNGHRLIATNTMPMFPGGGGNYINLANVYIDAAVNGEGVIFTYGKR